MVAAGDAAGNETGNGVTAVGGALSNAERQARFKARKRAERAAGRGRGKPLEPGHLASVRHGAYSGRLTGDRAREIADMFCRSAACPPDAGDDLTLMTAIAAWARAEARCERLNDYAAVIEAQLGDDAVPEMLTEVTEITGAESSTGPPQARTSKDVQSLVRQRESLSRAIDRQEARARSLRNDVWKRLEAHGDGRKAVSLTLLFEQDAAAEQAELDGAG